ncbi:MAG: hypothetical protein Q8858_13750 [Bacteroidota bacterium]|nr:hypothetical protein [Bacteroidota bacterium]
MEEEGSNVFISEMLGSVCQELSDLANISSSKGDFVLFLEPPSLDERIVNQFAFFSLMFDPAIILSQWLEEHPDSYFLDNNPFTSQMGNSR